MATEESILRLLHEDPSITQRGMASRLGLTIDGVKFHISKLKEKGIIRHEGPMDYYSRLILYCADMENDVEIVIWRYIDLGKFVDLLATESLYFSCPCEFEDPYEGLVPRSHVEAERKIFQKFIDDLLALKNQMAVQPADKKVQELLDANLSHLAKSMPEISKQVMLRFGVNCWHKNEFESDHGALNRNRVAESAEYAPNQPSSIICSIKNINPTRFARK